MKPEIFLLLERHWSVAEIVDLTGYPLGMVYRYRMLYKKANDRIEGLKLGIKDV